MLPDYATCAVRKLENLNVSQYSHLPENYLSNSPPDPSHRFSSVRPRPCAADTPVRWKNSPGPAGYCTRSGFWQTCTRPW